MPALIAKILVAEVANKKLLNHKTYEIDLKLIDPSEIDFKAGQFAMFVVDEKTKRAYSIVSLPSQKNMLTFCVDVSPNGPASQFIKNLNIGDRIKLQAPYGLFVVGDQDKEKDMLFVATGVGVAPFKSMITDLLETGYAKNLTLLLGMRSVQVSYYFDYFENLAAHHPNFKFFPILSQPEAEGDWHGLRGRVTDFLQKNGEFYLDHIIYICGGSEMIKDVRAVMIEKGLPKSNIKIEAFH